MGQKRVTIDESIKDWISVDSCSLDATIADTIQTMHCDTRDFHVIFSTEQPKICKNAESGYEYKRNHGLSKLYSVFRKQNREAYTINKSEILKFLDELCKASGGYEKEWRYLSVKDKIKNCEGWDIKYIRFVRNNKNRDEFVVCNSYLFPIEYKKIIGSIDKEYL